LYGVAAFGPIWNASLCFCKRGRIHMVPTRNRETRLRSRIRKKFWDDKGPVAFWVAGHAYSEG
jgi:hypothetical protein